MNEQAMRLTDKIHLTEAHTDQVVKETGLSRMEAYKLIRRQSHEVSKRIGVEPRMIESIAADGIVQEMGRV